MLSNPLERCKVVIQALPRDRCPSLPVLVRTFGKYSMGNAVSAVKREKRANPQGLMGGVGASVQRSAIVHAVQLSVYDSLRGFTDGLISSPLVSLVVASIFSGMFKSKAPSEI